jgi:hypothetical protein
MVITLTNLPAEIEEALQRKAEAEGKSVDRVTVDILARGLGVRHNETKCSSDDSLKELEGRAKISEKVISQTLVATGQNGPDDHAGAAFEEQRKRATMKPGTRRDLTFITGTWVEDPEFDKILEEQRRIDPDLWQ